MSEQTKTKQSAQAITERVKNYKAMEAALEQEKEAIKAELAELYNPTLKEQMWGKSFSYTPVGFQIDEPLTIHNYLLQNPERESVFNSIENMRKVCKKMEDDLHIEAEAWYTKTGVEMPKKPRAASFRLNKGGMQ